MTHSVHAVQCRLGAKLVASSE